RLDLPKFFAWPLQYLVRLACCVTFPALQNLAQRPARQRSQYRVNVIRHDHPGSQPVTCAGKKLHRARNQVGDVMLAQPTLPVADIEVGIDARRIPAEQLLLFMPRQRTLGCERLSEDGFPLCFELKQDFPRQRASQTKHHKIGSSIALEMRENISRMKSGDQSVGRCRLGGIAHGKVCNIRRQIWQVLASYRSAGFPACGFWGLSSPQFQAIVRNTELESSVNPRTGISALRRRPIGAAPLPMFRTLAEARVHRIHRRVLTTTIHVLIIADEMVKRLD